MGASRSDRSWKSHRGDLDAATIEESFRRDAARAIATLSRALGDLDRAEDAVQEAYLRALERWPEDGVPANPAAWIYVAARNSAFDRLRREQRGAEKSALLASLEAVALPLEDDDGAAPAVPDDRLNLIFGCCHPALNLDARVALTLRSLCGLSTAEIADAFLVSETTMAQRLVRAKRKIRDAGIPFRVPGAAALQERIGAVCTVIYLIFNQGYASTSGTSIVRDDLCREAIRLGRILLSLMPGESEVVALLALMLLAHSRRRARTDPAGEIVSLEEQDRSLWDRDAVEEGLELLRRAAAHGRDGPFLLQAALAAEHARAPDWDATNWSRIVLLYDGLLAIAPSPVVELNRAAALAMLQGPEAALAAMDRAAVDGELDDYFPYHASRAELLRRMARHYEAATAYRRALALAKNATQQRFLERRLDLIEP
jgi:RNA polymerase sigma-70 factor, ECF subfamily